MTLEVMYAIEILIYFLALVFGRLRSFFLNLDANTLLGRIFLSLYLEVEEDYTGNYHEVAKSELEWWTLGDFNGGACPIGPLTKRLKIKQI